MMVYLFIAIVILIIIQNVVFISLYLNLRRKCARLDVAIVNSIMTESEETIRKHVVSDYEKLVKITTSGSGYLSITQAKDLMRQAREINGLR